jgi:formate dehydrogenase
MKGAAVVDTSRLSTRRGTRSTPKGRVVDPAALEEVRALLGDAPRRADLLIEFLHRIQDAHGCLAAPHLVALAAELKLAPTEVYEVATFYHHFDVVKEGDARPPAITVRVCETLSCRMAGADALMASLARLGMHDVRVIGAPCVGRCESAPVAVVGRNPILRATPDAVRDAVQGKRVEPPPAQAIDYAAYRR